MRVAKSQVWVWQMELVTVAGDLDVLPYSHSMVGARGWVVVRVVVFSTCSRET